MVTAPNEISSYSPPFSPRTPVFSPFYYFYFPLRGSRFYDRSLNDAQSRVISDSRFSRHFTFSYFIWSLLTSTSQKLDCSFADTPSPQASLLSSRNSTRFPLFKLFFSLTFNLMLFKSDLRSGISACFS
jgi:hypothetical protein